MITCHKRPISLLIFLRRKPSAPFYRMQMSAYCLNAHANVFILGKSQEMNFAFEHNLMSCVMFFRLVYTGKSTSLALTE